MTRIAHVLKNHEPAQWGGIQTAFLRSLNALREREVFSVVFCPRRSDLNETDPVVSAGHPIQYFRACLPIWGLPASRRRELIALGDRLISFDLTEALQATPALDLIDIHTLGGLGAISYRVARRQQIPCVATLSNGLADLHTRMRVAPAKRPLWGFEWGKLFRLLLRPDRLLDRVDGIIVNNPAESGLLKERYPQKRIHLQPHGVALAPYETDCRAQAMAAFPQIKNRSVLLCPARIDPTKNQQWLLYQLPTILHEYPDVLLVMVGACTDEHYQNTLRQCIGRMGLANAALMTGALPPEDARLVGLFQYARALVVPSLIETVGVSILEAWAAGLPVIANRTSVASALVDHNADGWLFDLPHPQTLFEGLQRVLSHSIVAQQFAVEGRRRVLAEFDSYQLAGKLKGFYEELIGARLQSLERLEQRYTPVYAR